MSAMNLYPEWDPSLYQAQAHYNARMMQLAHANGRRPAAATAVPFDAEEDLPLDASDENAKKGKKRGPKKGRKAAKKGKKTGAKKAASGKKRGAKKGTSTAWTRFQKKHAGKGYTKRQLGIMYRKEKGLVKDRKTGRLHHRNADGGAEDADFSVSHMNGPAPQMFDDFVDPFDLAPLVPAHTNGRRFAVAAPVDEDDGDMELDASDENAKKKKRRRPAKKGAAKRGRSTSRGRKPAKRGASKGRKPAKKATKKRRSGKRTAWQTLSARYLKMGKSLTDASKAYQKMH